MNRWRDIEHLGEQPGPLMYALYRNACNFRPVTRHRERKPDPRCADPGPSRIWAVLSENCGYAWSLGQRSGSLLDVTRMRLHLASIGILIRCVAREARCR